MPVTLQSRPRAHGVSSRVEVPLLYLIKPGRARADASTLPRVHRVQGVGGCEVVKWARRVMHRLMHEWKFRGGGGNRLRKSGAPHPSLSLNRLFRFTRLSPSLAPSATLSFALPPWRAETPRAEAAWASS